MKTLLIATTALVCVTSLATAGTLPRRETGSSQSRLDTNGEFLCNYGFQLYTYVDSSFGFYFSKFERAATPVIGKGESVNEITVSDGQNDSGFQISIYTSYLNKPKAKLVSAYTLDVHRGCGRVNVGISPTKLERGKKYWIVQKAMRYVSSSYGTNSILWLYDKARTHGALSQSVSENCVNLSCSSQTGPWLPITGGVPYARVRESAGEPQSNRPVQSHDDAVNGSPSTGAIPTKRGGRERGIPRYPP